MPTKQSACRVALLYHDPLLRDIVHHVFDAAEDIAIVAEFPAAELAVDELVAAEPDVVVIDRRTMDDTVSNALAMLVGALVLRRPGVRIIALSLAEARVTVYSGWQMSDLSVDSLMAFVRGAEPAKLAQRPRRSRRRAAEAS
jgi:DNA-binding NarL/FixJ family response regulator